MRNKGFTLIELLVSILIISLLSGITVYFSTTFYKTNEEKYYNAIESSILLAGNDYFQDHRDELPTGSNYSEVSLANLIDNKYIEPVTDTDGNTCRNGSVFAYRENNIFKYEVCIVECGEYSSSGRYCEEAISREISVVAKTKNTNKTYDATKSYNAVSYAKDENVVVTLGMNEKYHITKYIVTSTKDNSEIICNTTSNNSCIVEINKSGTYKLESYENDQIISSRYISVKIAKNGPSFSLSTRDGQTKYLISKSNCASNKASDKLKNIIVDIIKGTQNEEYKKVEYRVNEGLYTEINNLSIELTLESGHYDIDVAITNYSDNVSIERISVDVSYLIDIEYEDGTAASTHEVVKGKSYNYLSNLPQTKLSYGQNLNIKWYKDNVEINPNTKIIEESCTHTIVGKTAIPVNIENFETYCKTIQYTGSEQVLTNNAPTNVSFINNKGTNAGNYTVKAHIGNGYVWSDGTLTDKEFTCTISKVAATLSCSDKTYTGSAQTGCTCSGGTIGGTYSATNAGSYTASCTGDANHTSPANKGWTIAKASSSITCANRNYTGSAQNMYSASSGCTPSTNKTATNAGTYTVSCTGDANHNNSSCSATMNKVAATLNCSNKTYTGSAQTGCTCSGGTIGGTYSATNAGSYTASCTGDANHTSPANKGWTIAKASSSITCANRNYTGSAQNMYSASSGCTPSTNKTATNAGTYTVSCTGDANHNNSSCSATMNKVDASITCKNPNYNGKEQEIATCSGGTISGHKKTSAGTYTVTCTGDSNHNTVTKSCGMNKASSSITCVNRNYTGSAQNMYSASSGCTPSTNKSVTNAGTYTVSCTGDANHNNSSCSATMNKVDASITCKNPNYNGKEQEIATCSGGTISGHKKTSAGTYTVTCTGDSNHNTVTKSCGMNKASSSITCVNRNYTGSAQNMYSTSSGCTPSTNKSVTNAGTYTVSCTGDANHNNSSCTATMNKVASSITCVNRTYNGSAQNMYSASIGCTPSTNKTATNAGTYTVSCTGDANHNNSSCSATMNRAIPSLTITETSASFMAGTTKTYGVIPGVNGHFDYASTNTSVVGINMESDAATCKKANTQCVFKLTGVAAGNNVVINHVYTPDDLTNYTTASVTFTATVTPAVYYRWRATCTCQLESPVSYYIYGNGSWTTEPAAATNCKNNVSSRCYSKCSSLSIQMISAGGCWTYTA